jgi:hypothetical protein
MRKIRIRILAGDFFQPKPAWAEAENPSGKNTAFPFYSSGKGVIRLVLAEKGVAGNRV